METQEKRQRDEKAVENGDGGNEDEGGRRDIGRYGVAEGRRHGRMDENGGRHSHATWMEERKLGLLLDMALDLEQAGWVPGLNGGWQDCH